ncbi:MAG: hypothetical protein NTX14_02685 [Candidatus Nealsonbacteria bacterium]|nr:hypothetical protein [Candidatus Nealsonbacteria bacterium]
MAEKFRLPTKEEAMAITAENLEDLSRLCRRMHSILKHEERRKIILALKDNGPMTRAELSVGAGNNQTSVHLSWLLAACFVCREKERPFRYSINEFLLQLLDLKLVHDRQRKQKNASVSMFRAA